MAKNRKFYEVEVSNATETVAALFEDLITARRYATDCEEIRSVTLVTITGPYTVFTHETVWKAYMRTWKMFNQLKGENDV